MSSSNDSLLKPNVSCINNYCLFDIHCLITGPSSLIYNGYFITNILFLLPLCTFVLYLGLQQWRQQRSTSKAMTSHSDSFTYHMAAMELIRVFGYILFSCGIYSGHFNMSLVAYFVFCYTWYGETFFHILTCVERYLAVVHPITYLSLRRERGIRMRNISIGCVWLLCIGVTSMLVSENASINVDSCLLIFSFVVISLCSVSVLRVLIRPGPGEQGGNRDKVDQSKQRSFYTIVAIMAVLLLRVSWNLMVTVLDAEIESHECLIMAAGVWTNIPSSLVLPLLFLHRTGTLSCCRNNI